MFLYHDQDGKKIKEYYGPVSMLLIFLKVFERLIH